MNFASWSLHPRRFLQEARVLIGLGRRFRGLQTIPFASGLGDSAWVLYGLTRALKPQVCVEIGSARGKSACFVGSALRDNGAGKLYAIDPHVPTEWNDDNSVDTYDVFIQNVRSLRLEPWIEMIRSASDQAAQGWNRTIDMLFIDGDHSYNGVKQDWNLFTPHLSPLGVVIFHDTAWDIDTDSWKEHARDNMGVPQFVEELRQAGYPIVTLPKDFGVSIVQHCPGGIALSKKGVRDTIKY